MSNEQKQGLLKRLLSSVGFLIDSDLNTDDRRRVPRLECSELVSFVTDTGSHGSGELLEVSSRGLRLQTETQLSKGRTIALNPPKIEELETLPPIMVKVVWFRSQKDGKHAVGLALPSELHDETTWLNEMLRSLGYKDDGSQRRQHIRAEAAIEGVLRLDDDQTERQFPVSVLNLGMGGALLRCPEAFVKNSQFSLTIGPHDDLPQISLMGTVLRVVEKDDYTFHPSRFRPLDDRDEKILREYILHLLGP